MKDYNKDFNLYLSACCGDNKSVWKIIKRFEEFIDYECGNNEDTKHTIILALYEFLKNSLNKRFNEYFEDLHK